MDSVRERLTAVMHPNPLDVQVQAAMALAEGRSLLVRLPTGTGKTILSSAPFAAGLLRPKQMVYMTPLRTLTSAQAGVLREEITSRAEWTAYGDQPVSEQTGTVAEDPDFLCPAVVCTFDQALSAVLHIPYALSARRRNITAGAVVTSYIVADEIHLYPRGEALATLLWFLINRPQIPFCLMTATMTQGAVERLSDLLGAEPLLILPEQDRRTLGLTDQRRIVRWQAEPLTAEGIQRVTEQSPRVLVVVNTVNRAITLGRELRALLGEKRVAILHSRYYRRDRDRITSTSLRAFGKGGSSDGPTVLVATQVVEAGLDISADVLLTELAPANALLQRWGRCARWGGAGRVVVAEPADRGYPYIAESGGEELLAAARTWLGEHASGAEGKVMGEAEEQEFVQYGHGAADLRWLDGLQTALARTAECIGQTVRTGEYANAGLLVRGVDQRKLIIHGDPDTIRQPQAVEGFGLRPGTLQGLAKRAGAQGGEAEPEEDEELISFSLPEPSQWFFMLPLWPEKGETSNARPDEVSGWRRLESTNELRAAPVVAVHPSLVWYDPNEGLQLRPGDAPTPESAWAHLAERAARTGYVPFTYTRETAEEHIRRALAVLYSRPELWPRLAPLVADIEAWLCWPEGLLRQVVEGSIVCHDAGKLAPAWQAEIRRVQERCGLPYELWLVHSDSGGGVDPDGPKKMPPHARSGAAHALELVRWLNSQVPKREAEPGPTLFTAIATHHNPSPHDLALGAVELLDVPARGEMARLLVLHGFPAAVLAPQEGDSFHTWLADYSDLRRPTHARTLFALSVVVRLLRLADGWSQERGGPRSIAGEET